MGKKKKHRKDEKACPDDLEYIADIKKKIERQQKALQKIIRNITQDN